MFSLFSNKTNVCVITTSKATVQGVITIQKLGVFDILTFERLCYYTRSSASQRDASPSRQLVLLLWYTDQKDNLRSFEIIQAGNYSTGGRLITPVNYTTIDRMRSMTHRKLQWPPTMLPSTPGNNRQKQDAVGHGRLRSQCRHLAN